MTDDELSARLDRVDSDLALALRAINRLLGAPGAPGRWSLADTVALEEVMDRRDPPSDDAPNA